MTATRYVKAIFADGSIAVRSSTTKTYTHAYSWAGTTSDARALADQGFASSEELARKGLASATAFLRTKPTGKYGRWAAQSWKPGKVELEIVAPVVEITAKEYREILDAKKTAP